MFSVFDSHFAHLLLISQVLLSRVIFTVSKKSTLVNYKDAEIFQNHEMPSLYNQQCDKTFLEGVDDYYKTLKSSNIYHTRSQASLTKTSKKFRTIVTLKTRGRLGNQLWAYMFLLFLEHTYEIEIIVEQKMKYILTTYFKHLDHLNTLEDLCGYKEFQAQYNSMVEGLIARKYNQLSGVNVSITITPHGITAHPIEVVFKFGKINPENVVDSEEFLSNFKIDYDKFPSDCPYRVSK